MSASSRDNVDSAKKVNGTTETTGIVQPTYKKLQDADSNWKPNPEMTKQNGTDADIDDGAQEKMLKDEGKVVITPSKNSIEQVKFGSSNGETKVDIEISKPILTGMGKEELMKFAIDPFWVRFRWILFISFWFLWFGMLAGAIIIIIMAPKCVAPEPTKVWEESVLVDLDFADATPSNFEGLITLLPNLTKHHIKSLSLPMFLAESTPGQTINFTDINKNYGSLEDFQKFINATKNLNQFVAIELNIHFSGKDHEWFQKSIQRDEKYADYYIWRNASNWVEGSLPEPPETSKLNRIDDAESKWKWNEVRKQFYLYYKKDSQPNFNFRNPQVLEEMKNILTYWIGHGVSGFRLTHKSDLIKKEDMLEKEENQNQDDKNILLVKELRKTVLSKTDGQGFLSFKEPMGNDIVQLYKNENAVDLAYTTQIVKTVSDSNLQPKEFANRISGLLKDDSKWPSWDLKRFATKMQPVEAENIMLFTMLLPGTPVVRLADINNDTQTMFDKLSEARNDPTFKYGNYSIDILHNNTVVAYTRIKSGNPGFLVAYYNGADTVEVDFSSMKFVPEELQTISYSSNYVRNGTKVQTKFSNIAVILQPKSTLALKFVPKIE